MTASTINDARAASDSARFSPIAGLGALLRKDTTEWIRGRRAAVVFVIATLFMALTAANGWITARIAENLPPDVVPPAVGSLDPLENVMAAVSGQIFVLATILAASSLIVAEREAGTLAWVASKPVSRGSIWLSKWMSATGILAIASGLAPLAITVGLVGVLYGMPPIAAVVGLGIGIVAVVAYFAAVLLLAGTLLPGQAAVAATGFGVLMLTPVLPALVPFDVAPLLPTAMLAWPAMALSGEEVSIVTPLAWAIVTGALGIIAVRRMTRVEL